MKKKLKCPLLNQPVYIYYVENFDDLIKRDNLINTETSKAFVYENKLGFHMVIRPDKYTEGVLVHEVVHLVNFLFAHVGQRLDYDNDEFQAYYTQYWFETIKKEIDKFNKHETNITTRD